MTSEGSREIVAVASATGKVAEATGKIVDAASAIGKWFGDVIGTVPQDMVGVIVGDYLREVRIRNIDRMRTRTEEILKSRSSSFRRRSVSPNIAVPLIEAAQDESVDEIRELWARLLANAMDQNKPDIRREFIDILKSLNRVDVLILSQFLGEPKLTGNFVIRDSGRHFGSEKIGVSVDQFEISADHLVKLKLLPNSGHYNTEPGKGVVWYIQLTALGRELMRMCSED